MGPCIKILLIKNLIKMYNERDSLTSKHNIILEGLTFCQNKLIIRLNNEQEYTMNAIP